MPKDCLDLLKLTDHACIECCLSLELTPCYLKVSQKECPDRPRVKFLLDTEVNQYYLIRINGRFTEGAGICVFAQSKEECPEIIQHRQPVTVGPDIGLPPEFRLIFKFKAQTPRTYVGLRFLEGQIKSQVEITKFQVCETKVAFPKPEIPYVIPITQRDIGCGDQLILCQPGHYRLVEDVTFRCQSAILIDSCHVRLDLGGHRITGQGDQTTEAILVRKAGFQLQDITIENGRLECVQGGIKFENVEEATLSKLVVTKARVAGYLFDKSHHVNISDCRAFNNDNIGFIIVGADPSDSTNFKLQDCQSSKNEIGFIIAGSKHRITDCCSNDNIVGFVNFNQEISNKFYHNSATNNPAANYTGVDLVYKPDCQSSWWINVDDTAPSCPPPPI